MEVQKVSDHSVKVFILDNKIKRRKEVLHIVQYSFVCNY